VFTLVSGMVPRIDCGFIPDVRIFCVGVTQARGVGVGMAVGNASRYIGHSLFRTETRLAVVARYRGNTSSPTIIEVGPQIWWT
jgi:hypothetical protein